MALAIVVEGVDIESITPQRGAASLYSGSVRVQIVPSGGTYFGEVKMSVPFQNVISLGNAVIKALNDLHDYGSALQQAAQVAASQYKP
jgi:hypothetical protein